MPGQEMDDTLAGLSAGRRDRRQQARRYRRRRATVGGAIVLVIALAVGVVLAMSGGEKKAVVAPGPTTTTPTVPTKPGVRTFTVATSKVAKLDVFAEPNTTSAKVATLDPNTTYRAPTTLLLDDARGATADGWLPVTVPLKKPNDTPGWIQRKDVSMSRTTYEIHIQLWTHTLSLLKDGHEVFSTKVIIGAPQTPTPTGRFYVTDPVNCNTESVKGYPVGQCSGAYGAFAMGTSALSEKLDSFDGTIPQIALHGTSLPDTELGKDLSNGCIRMPNAAIIKLASIQPLLGTPVVISLLGGSVRPGPASGAGGGAV